MRYALALFMLALVVAGQAQSGALYNPDINSDDVISAPDLIGFLPFYGQPFTPFPLGEIDTVAAGVEALLYAPDSGSVAAYMGQKNYFECQRACHDLPGNWSLPDMKLFTSVYSELVEDVESQSLNERMIWANINSEGYTVNQADQGYGDWWHINYLKFYTSLSTSDWSTRDVKGYVAEYAHFIHCYCATTEAPKVEYCYCESPGGWDDGSSIQECASSKVADGWYPLGGIQSHHKAPGFGALDVANTEFMYKVQAFWRYVP